MMSYLSDASHHCARCEVLSQENDRLKRGIESEAADRIEELEGALRTLVEFVEARGHERVAVTARAVLGDDRMAGEEWRPVPGFENYEVSSCGRVRSKPRSRTPGGLLKQFVRSGGYLSVSLGKTDAGVSIIRHVHRLVLLAFVGAPPSPEHQAAHLNGVNTDNTVANLAWVTKIENERHKLDHGTATRGDTAVYRKLTSDNVREIRASRGLVTQADLAKRFGVNRSCIQRIQAGQSWASVE